MVSSSSQRLLFIVVGLCLTGCLLDSSAFGPRDGGVDGDLASDADELDGEVERLLCFDGIQSGRETDVDCGGELCPSCLNGQRCDFDRDCQSNYCAGGLCRASHCQDGERSGDETDVDCGGERCDPCPPSRECLEDRDCDSRICEDFQCARSSCDDGVANGGESDVDCGGSCVSCENGRRCTTSADCQSLLCDERACRDATSCDDLIAYAVGFENGTFEVVPTAAIGLTTVYCDMETDDGGWTLVGVSRGLPLNDEREDWYTDLLTIRPELAHSGLWAGLREVIGQKGDIRFTCRVDANAEGWDVDLSFYDTDWYQVITTGSEAESCFLDGDDPGLFPARRNNLTGELREIGTPYRSGTLEGEDACDDGGDFTVDFDDRGVGGDPLDGTDWGEADDVAKCGSAPVVDGAWFVWVRTALWWLSGSK